MERDRAALKSAALSAAALFAADVLLAAAAVALAAAATVVAAAAQAGEAAQHHVQSARTREASKDEAVLRQSRLGEEHGERESACVWHARVAGPASGLTPPSGQRRQGGAASWGRSAALRLECMQELMARGRSGGVSTTD